MSFLTDTFTGTDGTNLTAHTGETGATWTKGSVNIGSWSITSNRARMGNSTNTYIIDVCSGTPASADYDVTAVMHYFTSVGGFIGICGRVQSPSPSATTFNCYVAAITAGVFQIRRHAGTPDVVSNPGSVLGTYSPGLVAGNDYTVKLQMRGSTISLWVNGVRRIQATDSTYTTAGRVGVAAYSASGTTVGVHFDSINAVDPPPIGDYNYLTNTGDWSALPYTVFDGADWIPATSVSAF